MQIILQRRPSIRKKKCVWSLLWVVNDALHHGCRRRLFRAEAVASSWRTSLRWPQVQQLLRDGPSEDDTMAATAALRDLGRVAHCAAERLSRSSPHDVALGQELVAIAASRVGIHRTVSCETLRADCEWLAGRIGSLVAIQGIDLRRMLEGAAEDERSNNDDVVFHLRSCAAALALT